MHDVTDDLVTVDLSFNFNSYCAFAIFVEYIATRLLLIVFRTEITAILDLYPITFRKEEETGRHWEI